MSTNKTILKRNKIKKRIRKVVFGSNERPRLSVYRSNKEIYAQIINDVNKKTIVSASSKDKELKIKSNNKTNNGSRDLKWSRKLIVCYSYLQDS